MDHDSVQVAIDLSRDALFLAAKLSLPLLAVGLLAGLLVSVLQAATQIQEATLSFVPKALAMAAALFAMLPWLLGQLTEYTVGVFRSLATLMLR